MRLSAKLAVPAALWLALGGTVAGLAACKPASEVTSSADGQGDAVISADAPVVATMSSEATPVARERLSCADELGATAAQGRADVCRQVSPATHPPCNVANSCAMIEDEIARSCALFADDGSAPMPQCTPSPRSSQAAAAVILRYYSAINARDYATAWQQWGDNGPPNQPLARFEEGFAHTRSTHVTIGALQPAEGGAGSIYQTVPVVVDATLDTGKNQRFKGEYVVRRVNDVDGASADQLRWHIGEAHLAAAPAG